MYRRRDAGISSVLVAGADASLHVDRSVPRGGVVSGIAEYHTGHFKQSLGLGCCVVQ